MGAAFLITLREGLEAALIVAIVMAYLRQLGHTDRFGWVAGGAFAGAAIALSVGVGVYLAVGELEGRAEQLTEGVIALAAVGVLTWMIFWMRHQARTIGTALRGQVDHALATGALFGLASITFVGVLREGIETSLFLLSVVFDSGAASTATGAFAGLCVAIVLGFAIYQGGRQINLRIFFQVTGGLIIIVAAGLFGKGVFQLQAADVFDSYHFPLWDLSGSSLLGTSQVAAFLRGLFGWSAQPSVEQVIVWAAYVATATWFFYHGRLPSALSEPAERWLRGAGLALASLLGRPVAAEADISERDR